jgi:hypothetical protein
MNDRVAIYYHPGNYGTFVEWCLNYFSDLLFNVELPFNESGNAHKFNKHTVVASDKMFQEAVKNNNKFVRLHPGSTSYEFRKLLLTPKQTANCYRQELKLLEQHFNYIIVIHCNIENMLWYNNNVIKCFDEKNYINLKHIERNEIQDYEGVFSKSLNEHILFRLKESSKHLVASWNKDSIQDMEVWELREFLSLYLYEEWINVHQELGILDKEFPNIIFLEISQLRDRFEETMVNLLKSLNLKQIRHDVNYVFENWSKLQYFKTRDSEVNNIVRCIMDGKDLSWHELSIIDEAEIQRQLRNNGWEIQCFNLNIFPTSTVELRPLLLKINNDYQH